MGAEARDARWPGEIAAVLTGVRAWRAAQVAVALAAVGRLERTLPDAPAGPPVQQLSAEGALDERGWPGYDRRR